MPLEKSLELRPHLRVLETQFDSCLEITELAAAIVAPALERVGDDAFFRQQVREWLEANCPPSQGGIVRR